MIYRLKNQEYQKRLDEISGGTFSKGLQNAIFDKKKEHICVSFSTVKERNFKLLNNMIPIKWDQIEETNSFDPRTWNNYPFVKPPLGVWMRVEFDNRFNGNIERHVARYIEEDGEPYWLDPQGYDICNVDRFRPWDD